MHSWRTSINRPMLQKPICLHVYILHSWQLCYCSWQANKTWLRQCPLFAKLARTQNVPGGGTDHAAVSNNTERRSGAAQPSTEPASTSAAPKRKRGRPSKAVAQAAAAAANTSEQDQQVQALAHYVDVQQQRKAEQRAEQAQSVKRSTRLLRNAAARRGPVPADLHDDIPASSDEADSE